MIAGLVIGLVASVGTFSIITSLFYGDMPGMAGRRSLARVFLRYDGPAGSEAGGAGRRIVTAPLSFNDFAIMREQPADSALEGMGAEGTLRMTAAGSHGPVLDRRRLRFRGLLQDPAYHAGSRPIPHA